MFDIFIRMNTLFKASYVHIDSPVFRMHWCFTSSILLVFSLFVLIRQYVGTPVSCIGGEIEGDSLNLYCWIHSTYTINSARNSVGRDVPHPGISGGNYEDERRYVTYYKWVGFTLFLQALLFYLPRWFWKNLEAGKINNLIKGMDSELISEVEKKQKQKRMLDYLYVNLTSHNSWAYWYFFCELLALLNVILQILLTNKFLNGFFLTFGIEILAFAGRDEEDRIDPGIFVFPRMTKCTFHKYGTSGNIEKHDALCILPLNIGYK